MQALAPVPSGNSTPKPRPWQGCSPLHHHSKRNPDAGNLNGPIIEYRSVCAAYNATYDVVGSAARKPSSKPSYRDPSHHGQPFTRPVIYLHRQPSVELGTGRSSCTRTTLVAVANPDPTTKTAGRVRLISRSFRRSAISLPHIIRCRKQSIINDWCGTSRPIPFVVKFACAK